MQVQANTASDNSPGAQAQGVEAAGRNPLISVQNIGVIYKSEHGGRDDYKSHIHNLLSGKLKKKSEELWAVRDISFEGYAGEILGIIGSNGSGKTTLCRVLSGLLRPDRGTVQINGLVSSLLSTGVGFNGNLSGRENIILNGMMLGYSRKRINKLLPSIEEFTGLGHFLKYPLKVYSNGMRARLGFSIASSLDAEIMVIDEVLGTGDLAFQQAAMKKMWQLVQGAKLVVVVSHNLEFVRKNCNRVLWIDRGLIRAVGDPEDVVSAYVKSSAVKVAPKKQEIVVYRETEAQKGDQTAVKVENLGVQFQLGKKQLWALDGVDFEIKEKEIVGIIGPNGAGKSTLCRTLCGLYRADRGRVEVNGSVTALLSFGTGFNVQLTGYDNIYLNGMMLGIPRKKIRTIEKEIIEFSELKQAISKPVKHYSDGMKSRLGFSIAAMLKPDIFIVDEALAAGDYSFREKATAKMQDMLQEAKAVIIVTHSLKIIEKVCTRALWFEEGKLIFDGDPKKAVKRYKKKMLKPGESEPD